MRVLWFETLIPSRYRNNGQLVGGWQDSLEEIVRTCSDIELYIAFESKNKDDRIKEVDGVSYIPILKNDSISYRIRSLWSWEPYATFLEAEMQRIIKEISPDIIQVFGVEWPFGRIAKFTNIPVVVHIMGSIVPYNNALYPPSYSAIDKIRLQGWSLKHVIGAILYDRKQKSWEASEREVWRSVKYYMGRTEWDNNLSYVMHPKRLYFHVDEALRPCFIEQKLIWRMPSEEKVTLLSTGCSTFWKGPDMMLKTARILKDRGFSFIWNVVGEMSEDIKTVVEKKEGAKFLDNNVNFVGFVKPTELAEMLCNSTIYVHTAYIENSPNSICEAQCLGVPIVSTNVGGISSLVADKKHGILVPANDPWQMAAAIMNLSSDKEKLYSFSESSRLCATKRHNSEIIKTQLLNCYSNILEIVNNN